MRHSRCSSHRLFTVWLLSAPRPALSSLAVESNSYLYDQLRSPHLLDLYLFSPLSSLMGVKLNERFKKLHHQLFSDDAGNVALEATIKALETGRVFIELAPVPGLSAVVDVLVGILKKVQVSNVCSIYDRRFSL